ncbi:MAG: fructose-bisphosphatase class II [Candidatus Polarisedimenticolia bacterium]
MNTTSSVPGRRTGVQTVLPPRLLASGQIWSRAVRRLGHAEVEHWNQRNARLLDQYDLDIAAVDVLSLDPPVTVKGTKGALQTEHRDRLILTAAMGALAVSLSGRGDLLAVEPSQRDRLKLACKETNDRNSTAAMAEALYAMRDASAGFRLRIAIGEGARLKPGERGGNPTLYAGMEIGRGDGPLYHLAVDTVEGTTKSTLFDPSCGTLLFITDAEIPAVPDMYFDKCQLHDVDGVSVADPLERIVQALMDARGTRDVNIFSLDRGRHPIDRMVELGACMRVDTDSDAYPAVASGLAWGVYPDNLRPLDGVCADIGGAAETLAAASGAWYLGVRSSARFCTGKVKRWEERYDLDDHEREDIRSRGLDPAKVYRIEDLIPGLPRADGAFVASAISDNWHIPGMRAAFIGGNFATVDTLFIGSAGTAEICTITFAYRQPWERIVETITPVLTRLLRLPVEDIPRAVRQAVADPARAARLRHEIATSYYSLAAEHAPAESDEPRIRLDLESAARAESPTSMSVLRAAMEAAPDWFI